MIVVDTSVWIDVFNENDSREAAACVALLEEGDPVAITEVIFTEVLQGIGEEHRARHVEGHLRAFPVLGLGDLDAWSYAADLYRTARQNGVTIRNTADCLIASPCIRAGATLLHRDADFDRLAECSPLKTWSG